MNVTRTIWIALLFVGGGEVCRAQESFSDLTTPHFRLRFQEGILRTQARTVGDYLEQDFGYLRKVLGLEPERTIEFRLYDSQTGFRSGTGNRQAIKVETKRGVVHVSPVGRLEKEGELAQTLSFGLSLAMLEQSMNNGAPRWLVRSFAVYHSGIMADLPVPAGRRVSYFSDLDQELQEASGSSDKDRVNYLLGITMKFFVDVFGEKQAYGLFAAFDGTRDIDAVFHEVLARSYQEVERSWNGALSKALDDRSDGKGRGD